MNRSIIYVSCQQGYVQTTRQTNHPSLVSSRANNVKLPYTVCHEVYKGPSKFISAQSQQIYNSYTKKMQVKSDLQKSQFTTDCSQINENLSLTNKKVKVDADKKSLFHSEIIQNKQRRNGNQDLFVSYLEQELIQVQSQNGNENQTTEKEQLEKLRNILKQKNKQVEYLKQSLHQTKQKYISAENKLQLIKVISNHDEKTLYSSTLGQNKENSQYKQSINNKVNILLKLISKQIE